MVDRTARIATASVVLMAALTVTPIVLPAAEWVAAAPGTLATALDGLLISPIGVGLSALLALTVARLVAAD